MVDHGFLIFLNLPRMSKRSKKRECKGKGTKVEIAVAGTSDDFDDMLADLRAADVTAEAATSSGRSASSNNSSSTTPTTSSSTTNQASTVITGEVSEEALVQACVRGDLSQLRRWARRGIRVTSAEPLCNAVSYGNFEVAHYLVRELGADVNEASAQGFGPLCIAAHAGNLRMVKYLAVDLGADVNQTGKEGHMPLFVAAQLGHLAVMRYLVKELGADINRSNNAGFSPLFTAVQGGKLKVVRYLVKELGANVNQTNNAGYSPLYFAVLEGNLEMVQCLVEELGAYVNLVVEHGITPLMVAAEHMHPKVVRYLLTHGADTQALYNGMGTAADVSRIFGAPAEQTAYLAARTHCANPGCTKAGLKKCERCLQAYFCGSACIRAHWPAHKVECTAAAAKLRAAAGAPSSSSSSSVSSSSP
jgi:ankyrin repeat protein